MSFDVLRQLLDNGYSEEELLSSLVKTLPKLAKKSSRLLSGGWGIKDVLGFFSKEKEVQSAVKKGLKPTTPNEIAAMRLRNSYTNIAKNQEEQSKEEIQGFINKAAPLAIGGLAAPMAKKALQHAIPTILQDGLQQASPQTPQAPQETNILAPSQPPISPNISQPAQNQQPERISNQLWEALQSGKTKGFEQGDRALLKIAKRMQTTGEIQSEQDFNLLKEIYEKKKAEGKGLPSALKEASQEFDKQKMAKANQPSLPGLEEPGEPQAPKIEKKSIVASPQGVGEVLEIRNGKALIDVDGKKHQVDESELESEPEEVKESKIDIDLDKIPENLRSAPLNEVYIPSHQKHITVKFNSNSGVEKDKRYLYYKKDGSSIDPKIIENLRTGSQIPVTSGKTFWGAWGSNTQDSRGTVAFHELTQLAQREGEEDDSSKPYWFVEEEEVFTHGYRKEYERELKKKEKEFNAKNKKPKKKPT